MPTDPDAQRRQLAAATAEACTELWSPTGWWVGPHALSAEAPAWLHLARSLLITAAPGMTELGNLILSRAGFDTELHFKVMASVALLLDHSDRLDSAVQSRLQRVVEQGMGSLQAPDMGFVAVNDNYPMMAAFGLTVGGQLVGDRRAVAAGEQLLADGTRQFRRRGVSPEYGSPTYSAIQLVALAEIARRTSDTAIAEAAEALEERTWIDVAMHFHPRLDRLVGPFSRSFLRDTINIPSLVNDVCWFALGCGPSPLDHLFGQRPAHWERADPSIHNRRAAAVWVTDTEYHPPSDLISALIDGPLPRTASATYEFAASRDALAVPATPVVGEVYPAGVGVTTTHVTAALAVGSATVPFHNGTHGDPFHISYDCGAGNDPGSVHARYLVDNNEPGSRSNSYPTFAVTGQAATGSPSLWDEGRPVTLQHGHVVMSIYRPKLYATYGVSQLRLSVMVSLAERDVDEVWLS